MGPKMDFMHILGQKEATWNTIFSIFERLRGPPNVAGPRKTPPLDGPAFILLQSTPILETDIIFTETTLGNERGTTTCVHLYKG